MSWQPIEVELVPDPNFTPILVDFTPPALPTPKPVAGKKEN